MVAPDVMERRHRRLVAALERAVLAAEPGVAVTVRVVIEPAAGGGRHARITLAALDGMLLTRDVAFPADDVAAALSDGGLGP